MGRGASTQSDEILYGTTPARVRRRASGIVVHNYGRDKFFAEPPSPQRLGLIAQATALLGCQVHAKVIHAGFEREVTAVADSEGVEINQGPQDLPFQEHPEYNAPSRRTLVDNTPIKLALATKPTKKTPIEAGLQYAAAVDPSSLRVKLEEERELVVDFYNVTVYKRVPRRLFGTKREVVERVARPRH